MKLKNLQWELFEDWVWGGRSFYKLALMHGVDKSNIRYICESLVAPAFKNPLWDQEAYRSFKKIVKLCFPSVELYKKFYEYNQKKQS